MCGGYARKSAGSGKGKDIVMGNTSEKDIDNLMKILDGFCDAGERRMKLQVSEELEAGDTRHDYHLGCCDIGSPWAKGTAFDVLEDEEEE